MNVPKVPKGLSTQEFDQWMKDNIFSNPEIRARREQIERERQERVFRLTAEQAQLIADLREAGYRVKSIWDLVNFHEPYPEAIPVLLRHVQRNPPYSETTLGGLIRSLTVKEAKGAFGKIALKMFREDTHEPKANGVRWCLGNALLVVAQLDDVDEMIELVRDRGHGRGRAELPGALVRFVGRRPDIVTVLESLRDDPDIKDRVEIALSRKAVAKAREKLRGFAEDSQP